MAADTYLQNIDGLDMNTGFDKHKKEIKQYIKALKDYKFTILRELETLKRLGTPGLMKTINETNLERYRLTAKKIMETSEDMCAGKVAGYAKYLADAAKAADIDYISRYNPAIISYLQKMTEDIDAALTDYYKRNPKPTQEKPDGYLLAKLRVACRSYRTDIIDDTTEEICRYQYDVDNELVQWIETNIGMQSYGIVAERLLNGRIK